jgi:hypothetical protein
MDDEAMQLIYLTQDDRFYVRLTPEACGRLPAGAFNPTINMPVYALRVDGEGEAAPTFMLVPSAEGQFHWVPLADTRLARR